MAELNKRRGDPSCIRLDHPYFTGLIKDVDLKKIFEYLVGVAKKYLGDVHHICTNDYLKRDGVILWTDHGFFHTSKCLIKYSRSA